MKNIVVGDVKLPFNRFVVSGTALLGIKGAGKSVTAKGVVEQVMDADVPVTVFDPIGVWRYLKTPGNGPHAHGYPVVVAGGEKPDLPLTPANASEIVRAAMRAKVSLVIDLYDANLSKADWRRIVQTCFKTMLYENKPFGPRYVVLEEAAEYCPQKVYDGETYAMVEKFVRMGGNAQLGLMLINQRSQEVNKAVLDLCENLVLMRQRGAHAIDAVQKWLDAVSPDTADKITASLSSMEKGDCWVWAEDAEHPRRTHCPMPRSFHPDRTLSQADISARRSVDTNDFVAKMLGELPKVEAEKKLNDPKALHIRIGELERQLEAKPVTTKVENVPMLTDHERKRITALIDSITALDTKAESLLVKVGELAVASAVMKDDATAMRLLLDGKVMPIPPIKMVAGPSRVFERPVFVQTLSQPRHNPPPHPKPAAPNNGDSDITKGAREVLKAIAQFDGCDDTQIAVLTGYKKTSRTTFKQQLQSRGLISKAGDNYVATEEGVATLGGDFERLPEGDALREHWNRKLSGGELVCFQAFCEAHPNDLSNEDLMAKTGYLKTSITTFKQRLTARKLIDGRRANPNLFG